MLTKKYPSTTRIVGIVLRSYIPNSGDEYNKIVSQIVEKEVEVKKEYVSAINEEGGVAHLTLNFE